MNNGILLNFSLTGSASNWLCDVTSAVSDINLLNGTIQIFPNPSPEYIQIKALTKAEKFKIYNEFWAMLKAETTDNNMKINVQGFTNGLYFLKLENDKTFKFLKE